MAAAAPAEPQAPESGAPESRAPESAATPADVLHSEEAGRTRIFFRVVVATFLLLELFLLALPGQPWMRAATGVLGLALIAIAVGVLLQLRDDRKLTTKLLTQVGVVGAFLTVLIVYYLGAFSAAAVMLVLCVFYFGLSSSAQAARAVYASVAGIYFVVSLAVAAGVVPDPSVFASSSEVWRLYHVFMMQIAFGLSYYLARNSRRAAVLAVTRARRMSRELRQRESQLAEARSELDWALRTGEGQMSGQTVGDYRLEKLLGRGGMGEVYAAKHVPSGQPAALKLLHPNMLENPEYVQRFMREAQAAAAVPSEHVAQVYELGFTPSGGPFIAMELLEGHDLAWHLRKASRGRLPLETVVVMVEHAARALGAVRDAGVVHRDLKPANLFLVDSLPQTWKVLDFGLSKIQGGAALTREVAMGTPQYMPPEQAQGLPVDHRADLYALAAIAYRTLTGEPPFVGEDIGPLLLDVLYTQPQQPGMFVRVPVEVELVLAIALAKKADDRFACVEDFALALSLAAVGDLDDDTRTHGWNLVKAHPWGTTTRR